MNALVSSGEMANDVTGAEALIERHQVRCYAWLGLIIKRNWLLPLFILCWLPLQEHRAEIDARSGTFNNFENFGQELVENNHYATPEIQEHITETLQARSKLAE